MRGIMIYILVFSSLLSGCAALNGGAGKIPVQRAVPFVPAGGAQQEREDNVSYDCGRIQAGEVVEHSFLLRNEGKKKLTITGTVASCGCTSSSVRKSALVPGEETFLDVKFDSKGFSGTVAQFVYVNTDDIDNQARKFIIKAVVVPREGE